MDKKLYKLMNWAEIEAIVYSDDDHPLDVLGAHYVSGGYLIQAYIPNAKSVTAIVMINGSATNYQMEKADDDGFFAVHVKAKAKAEMKYHFNVQFEDGTIKIVEDPYRFYPEIKKEELEKFNAGINYRVYDILGAHVKTIDGVKGVMFAVWAPNAVRISVVGDFNNWDGRVHQMQRLGDSGVFALFIPGCKDGEIYKYELKLKGGMISLKADPYAFYSELRPNTASVVYDISGFDWTDSEFIKKRKYRNCHEKPMAIYELYLGSFKKPEDGREYYTYRELAPMVCEYVKEMGYTHIELMPVMEHPLDQSWGYQVIGYYSPTSRYGTPGDFMYFINYMHENGIYVILDWVPAHFPRDIHGLSSFDGTCLYEHYDERLGTHPHWGTLIFNYGRPEVSNYLIANALYWINEYHADGIRIDAVASMLYLDYGRNDGEWLANVYGGNENLEAIELIKHLNSINKKMETGAIMIAEESTAWPKVTGSLNDDGLGFDFKWNMGWMNDFIGFMRYDPYFRSHHYGELTFSMIYAYSERFMLVFSHDEVVHGKASMIGKMPGERKDQFANLRLAYAYMFAHPGKKLSFMGQDIAEYDEWNEQRGVEWELLKYDEHNQFNTFMKELISFYREHSALYMLDNVPEGFEWINHISANESILAFLRKDKNNENIILVVCNFANIERDQYKIGVPFYGKYKEVFNSDDEKYGGSGYVNPRIKQAKDEECDDREYSIRIKIAPLSVSMFTCSKEEAPKKEIKKVEKNVTTKKHTVNKKNLKKELESKFEEERAISNQGDNM